METALWLFQQAKSLDDQVFTMLMLQKAAVEVQCSLRWLELTLSVYVRKSGSDIILLLKRVYYNGVWVG